MQRLLIVMVLLTAGVLMSATTSTQPSLKAAMERGKKVYTLYCLACHQADGNGVPRLNPPLVKTSYVLGKKDPLIMIVLKGMNEEVEINGRFYENVMAPHAFLKDQEVADVLTYVRNSFGNKASMVMVKEVQTVRARLAKDSTAR